jgi:formylmethanofuran dehydrogenase subunit B
LSSPAGSREPNAPLNDSVPSAVSAVTCLGCGCLCDDIEVAMDGGQIVEARRACEVGWRWFETEGRQPEAPLATVEGEFAEAEPALERAADVLRRAKRPVVFGLTRSVTETTRAALALADRLGALVLLERTRAELDRIASFQDSGRVTATLGEVKGRADLVVFWGVDPVTTHPRHCERYSTEPVGRYVPEGRSGRTVIVIDVERTATASKADLFVELGSDRDLELCTALRLLIHEPTTSDPSELARSCGVEPSSLTRLVALLRGARYGAIFYGNRRPAEGGARVVWDSASSLVRDLNGVTRFVLMSLGRPGNVAGAEAALAWQTGYPQSLDFGTGFPVPVDDTVTLDEVLAAGEADALLIVADHLPEGLSSAAESHLKTIPIVVIGPERAQRAARRPTVGLLSSTTGIEVSGTVTRSDGVVLPLRPLRPSRYPSDRNWVERILQRIVEIGSAIEAPAGSS